MLSVGNVSLVVLEGGYCLHLTKYSMKLKPSLLFYRTICPDIVRKQIRFWVCEELEFGVYPEGDLLCDTSPYERFSPSLV